MKNSLRITSTLTPSIKSSDSLEHRFVNNTQCLLVAGSNGGDDMYRNRQISRILIFTTLLFIVTSCAVLKLDPPGSDIQSILILPFKVTDNTKSGSSKYEFKYGYEIVNVDDESIKYEAFFQLSNKDGILIVDFIPPGYYFVNKISVFRIGSGIRTFGKERTSRYDTFELESGMITIFPISLDISVVDHPTEPGSRQYYSNTSLVNQSQKEQIFKQLKELENFDKWEVFGM